MVEEKMKKRWKLVGENEEREEVGDIKIGEADATEGSGRRATATRAIEVEPWQTPNRKDSCGRVTIGLDALGRRGANEQSRLAGSPNGCRGRLPFALARAPKRRRAFCPHLHGSMVSCARK